MSNNLILRTLTSPYNDITRGSVLSQADVDNNFIFLKGNIIYTAETNGSSVILKKYNGDEFSINVTAETPSLSAVTSVGNTTTDDIIISAKTKTTNLQITSGATTGYVLTSLDSDGNVLWLPASGITGIGTTKKYSTTLTSPSGGTYTITHNLATTDISVSLWLVTTGDLTTARVTNRQTNSVDVIFSISPSEDVRVVIIG